MLATLVINFCKQNFKYYFTVWISNKINYIKTILSMIKFYIHLFRLSDIVTLMISLYFSS